MKKRFYLSLSCLFVANSSYAANGGSGNFNTQPVFPEDLSLPELIRQDQRLNDFKQQLDTQTIIQPAASNLLKDQVLIVAEDPCFDIQKIEVTVDDPNLKAMDTFSFLSKTLNKKSQAIVGQCIGTQSLQNVVRFAQNELIKKGFVTSQIVVHEQDMTQGILNFKIVPGRIAEIVHDGPHISKLQLITALPFKEGDMWSA